MDSKQLSNFMENGYLIVDSGIDESVLDQAVEDTSAYWDARREKPVGATTYDYNRVQDAWKISRSIKTLARHPNIITLLNGLYGKQAKPFQTLNFYKGTQQKVHSDSIHFNSEPFGLMCGVWIALEDVGAEQGPLIYYPGSQKLPEMNFEDMELLPDYKYYPQYEKYLENLIVERDLQPEYGLLKKGQALIWAANLLHGGSLQVNKALTRQSQVTHYFFEGARPWRPGHSAEGRSYFTPEWIPLKDEPRFVSKLPNPLRKPFRKLFAQRA